MKRIVRRLTAVAGSAVIAAGLSPLAASPAQAWSIDITDERPGRAWYDTTWSQPCNDNWCLYYSPALRNGGWVSAVYVQDPDLYNNYFGNKGWGSGGVGQSVKNNAASVGNRRYLCTVAVYDDEVYQGNRNYLYGDWAADLTDEDDDPRTVMRNRNKSIRVSSCG